MSRPYAMEQKVFSSAVATETKALNAEFALCPTKVIEIVTTGFSGTLDIKGALLPAGTKDNIAYARMSQDGVQSPVNDQLSFSTDTARYRYITYEPYPNIDLVMTRSAGSISVNAFGYGGVSNFPFDGFLPDDRELKFGNSFASPNVSILWETEDANANCLMFNLPTGGAVDVPVVVFGIGIKTVDLGFFNGKTYPHVALVDNDQDSWFALTFNDDDVPEIVIGGAATYLKLPAIQATSVTIYQSENFLYLTETDQTDPAGRWRWRLEADILYLEHALTASWATDEDWVAYDYGNALVNYLKPILLGTWGDGSGLVLDDDVNSAYRIFAELPASGDALSAGKSIRAAWHRALVNKAQTNMVTIVGTEAQIRVKANLADGVHAGLWAYFEQSGTVVLASPGQNAAISATVEGADALTLNSGATLSGLVLDSSVGGSATLTGEFDAIWVKAGSGKYDWKHIISVTPDGDQDVSIVYLGGITGDPTFSWDESLDSFAFNKSITLADTTAILTGGQDGDYFSIFAHDDDSADDTVAVELMRFVSASAPYITIGAPTAYKVKFDPAVSGIYFGDGSDSWDFLLKYYDGSDLAVRNAADDAYKGLRVTELLIDSRIVPVVDATYISAGAATNWYLTLRAMDTDVTAVEIGRLVGAADPYFRIGRDDTGVATDAVCDMFVLQAGAGTNNEEANFGLGISMLIGNAASEVEERGSIDLVLTTATNGSEASKFVISTMAAGGMVATLDLSNDATKSTILGVTGDYWRFGDACTTAHSLDSEDDVVITGDAEVHTNLYVDGDLYTGTLDIDDDSGVVTIMDMGVTASPADGTEESIGFAIDGNIMLKLYTEADHAGAVDTFQIRLLDTIAIATGILDDDYYTFKGVDNDDQSLKEVGRVQGATDPYFSMGGSQEFKFYYSGVAAFGGDVTFADAKNIILNTTTGTKIGTATDQKLGFFNAAPVIQQTGVAAQKTDYATPDLDTEAEIITAINTTNAAINTLRTAINALGLTTTV